MTILDHPVSHGRSVTRGVPADGVQILSADHRPCGAQSTAVGGESDHPTGHSRADARAGHAGGANSPDGRNTNGTQTTAAVRAKTPPVEAVDETPSVPPSPRLADPLLTLRAAILDDLEKVRTANTNRLRILTTPLGAVDKDGESRGWGLHADAPEVRSLQVLVDGIEQLEKAAILDLRRSMRTHPLNAWMKTRHGVGDKQLPRLLSAIGDPYWNTLHHRPRTVSELWAYCGLHTLPGGPEPLDPQQLHAAGGKLPGGDALPGGLGAGTNVAARRRKGQKSNWSTTAKTRTYLIAESCIKQARSPYRAVYDTRRAHTALTHPEWTAGHSHADGMRVASKAILRDLWIAARDLHTAEEVTP